MEVEGTEAVTSAGKKSSSLEQQQTSKDEMNRDDTADEGEQRHGTAPCPTQGNRCQQCQGKAGINAEEKTSAREENNCNSRDHICQADGCAAILVNTASNSRARFKLCPAHLKAEIVVVKGEDGRFCTQCLRVHPLSRFEGTLRSCMARRARRRQRQRQLQRKKQVTQNTASLPGAAMNQQGTTRGSSFDFPAETAGSQQTPDDNASGIQRTACASTKRPVEYNSDAARDCHVKHRRSSSIAEESYLGLPGSDQREYYAATVRHVQLQVSSTDFPRNSRQRSNDVFPFNRLPQRHIQQGYTAVMARPARALDDANSETASRNSPESQRQEGDADSCGFNSQRSIARSSPLETIGIQEVRAIEEPRSGYLAQNDCVEALFDVWTGLGATLTTPYSVPSVNLCEDDMRFIEEGRGIHTGHRYASCASEFYA